MPVHIAPNHRRCAIPSCRKPLCMYNNTARCWQCGGWREDDSGWHNALSDLANEAGYRSAVIPPSLEVRMAERAEIEQLMTEEP